MYDDIQGLLNASKIVNSKVISLTRCLILTLVAYSVDGIQYRELKAVLNISDGKLIANVNRLALMGYIRKSEIELDQKKMDAYFLTNEGKEELSRIKQWIDNLHKVVSKVC